MSMLCASLGYLGAKLHTYIGLIFNASGIGGQTALKLIRQHGSIESVIENINRERYIFILSLETCQIVVSGKAESQENMLSRFWILRYSSHFLDLKVWCSSFASCSLVDCLSLLPAFTLQAVAFDFAYAIEVQFHLLCFRYQIPDDWPYQEARKLFKEPEVVTDENQLDFKWNAPDEEVSYFN